MTLEVTTIEDWPRQLLAAALQDGLPGLETMRLLLAQPEWVHRRVDALEYRDGTTFRRRQSVHFTVPAAAPEVRIAETTARLIPLTTLRKETLVNFDCRDESGAALPVLTRSQQSLLVVTGMTGWAAGIVDAPLDADVAEEIESILTDPRGATGGTSPADRFRAGVGQRRALLADPLYALVLDQLADQLEAQRIGDGVGDQRFRQSMSLAVRSKATARAS